MKWFTRSPVKMTGDPVAILATLDDVTASIIANTGDRLNETGDRD